MVAWFNKKKAKAIAKAEEKLRAAVERKVKAEAEKMLLTQHRRYSLLAERVEAQAKEAIAAAKAEAKEAVEKNRSYAAALIQAEKKLIEAQEQARTEAVARAKAEESLLVSAKAKAAAGKAESKERQRVEAQAKEAIAGAKAQAEEKIQSYVAALAQAEEKLAKAEAKAAENLKTESEERQRIEAQPAGTIKIFKRIRHYVLHPGAIKRKFAFLSALAILSAIAFGVSVLNDTPVAEPGSATTHEETPVPITLMGSDPDGERPTYNVVTNQFHGSLSGPASSMTSTPALNYNFPDNFTLRSKDGDSIGALDKHSFTITVNPAPPNIATLTVLDGYNQRNARRLSADGKTNAVEYSDNDRSKTIFGLPISYDFSDVSIPADAAITSVVVFVEHFEEERFSQGTLEWAVGTGWPSKPVVWAEIKAPVHKGQSNEAIDAWDVTSVVDTREKINSLQLQIKNNNKVINRKTLIDYIYVIVEWD